MNETNYRTVGKGYNNLGDKVACDRCDRLYSPDLFECPQCGTPAKIDMKQLQAVTQQLYKLVAEAKKTLKELRDHRNVSEK